MGEVRVFTNSFCQQELSQHYLNHKKKNNTVILLPLSNIIENSALIEGYFSPLKLSIWKMEYLYLIFMATNNKCAIRLQIHLNLQ